MISSTQWFARRQFPGGVGALALDGCRGSLLLNQSPRVCGRRVVHVPHALHWTTGHLLLWSNAVTALSPNWGCCACFLAEGERQAAALLLPATKVGGSKQGAATSSRYPPSLPSCLAADPPTTTMRWNGSPSAVLCAGRQFPGRVGGRTGGH